MTKSAQNCGFGHIYRRNPKYKTFFCAVLKFAIFLKSSLRFSQFLLSFLLIGKTLRFNYIKTRTVMKANFSVFAICIEYYLHDCTFKDTAGIFKRKGQCIQTMNTF